LLIGGSSYFEFNYPPTVGQVSKKTHGLIPVWGFADVIESTHPGIRIGERVYGYLAPTRYLLLPVSEKDINKYYFCA
jgi:tRNA U38,U39,U40 pseudouridine synthase TruA